MTNERRKGDKLTKSLFKTENQKTVIYSSCPTSQIKSICSHMCICVCVYASVTVPRNRIILVSGKRNKGSLSQMIDL